MRPLSGENVSMKKSPFMIQDYPHLVKYFASRNPLHLLMFVVPLWIFISYHLLKLNVAVSIFGIGFFSGVLYWTFLEYAIHRWGYHSAYKSKMVYYFLGSFHLYHHKDMSDHRILNAGFLMIYFLTPLVVSPFILLFSSSFVVSMALGLSLSYYSYECVHYFIHYKQYDSGYLKYIQNFHLHHHDKAPNKNFGNTSHLWDALLGSYDPTFKTYAMSSKTHETLITSKAGLNA